MTLRDALRGSESAIRRRLEDVLDSEDAVVVLTDARGTTIFAHGFALSGCQLEMLGRELEALLPQPHRAPARPPSAHTM